MNLKKIILCLAVTAFLTAPVYSASSPNTNTIISLYKAQNYLGCIQTTDKILEKNPSDVYALYYQALSYAQIGKKDKAIDSFEKVIKLNSNEELVRNAKKAKACTKSPEDCAQYDEKVDDFDKFLNSSKFYTEKVQTDINQKKLDKIRQNMNEEFTMETGAKKSEAPTNEEIANAVKTLAKVGFNPMNNMNMYQSPEMMQMNMLLGDNSGNNNNGFNNMLPYLLMGQNQDGTNKISPELIQTMMMSQMNTY